ncbi:MAG: hypothetical protein O2905_00920 [Proteobacteria bacterium]|nr:hypothetical protein [Pseudomonadota bacterium]MDA1131772.1 hypothetical protein [Pseudomonadota bacterium]
MTLTPTRDGSGAPPVVLIVLFRALDMRLMLNTGLVEQLCRDTRVVLLAPPELLPALRASLPEVSLEPLLYGSSKYESGARTTAPIRRKLESLLRETLRLTFGRPAGHENWTRLLHTATYRQSARSFGGRVAREAILALAWLACRARPVRRGLQRLAALVLRGRLHAPVFARWRPKALVVCSVGLELDARLILEARSHGVPSVAVVQSWDKTSSKGYPLAQPDRVLVWSDIMANECEGFLDIPRAAVEVTGAPIFDAYFDKSRRRPREAFLSDLGLDPSRTMIYCALCSPAWHAGNLELAQLLGASAKENRFARPAALVLRVHPAYFDTADPAVAGQRRELFDVLDRLGTSPHIHINRPDLSEQERTYTLNPSDIDFVTNLFASCDVSVSVLSTQMIEAALFDRPIVAIEYGRWISTALTADLATFRLEHLERILDTGAASRVRRPDDLVAAIDAALLDPAARSDARSHLARQEVSANWGGATAATAAAIRAVAIR